LCPSEEFEDKVQRENAGECTARDKTYIDIDRATVIIKATVFVAKGLLAARAGVRQKVEALTCRPLAVTAQLREFHIRGLKKRITISNYGEWRKPPADSRTARGRRFCIKLPAQIS